MESKSSKKREAIAIFSERFEQWEASQEGQQDAYAFEEKLGKVCGANQPGSIAASSWGGEGQQKKNDKQ
ncbi:MAG: hypothetical protein AAGI25_19365 [Bacteroidota bacterium]